MNLTANSRTFLILIPLSFFAHSLLSQAAMFNYKPTTWKDKFTWIDGRVPGDTDHVVLINDIVIDTNAKCKSLTTNGWSVNILPGSTLEITGNDSLQQSNNDSLISAIAWRRYVSENDSININGYSIYKTFEYDSLKRISHIVTKNDFADDELHFFYQGNNHLPYKTIKYDPCDYQENNVCIVTTDTSFYLYDSTGRMIADSSQRWMSNAPIVTTSINSYLYGSDHILNIHKYNSPVNDTTGWHVSEFTIDTLIVFQNTPLPDAFSQMAYVHPIQAGSYFYQYTFFMDQWENPLYRTSMPYPIISDEQLFFDFPEMKHNKTSYSFTDSNGYNSYLLSYRYLSNKLPAECILHSFSSDPGVIYSFSYDYTH